MDTINNIGGTGLPIEASNVLFDLITKLEETFDFKNGSTAAYIHVSVILADHIKGYK